MLSFKADTCGVKLHVQHGRIPVAIDFEIDYPIIHIFLQITFDIFISCRLVKRGRSDLDGYKFYPIVRTGFSSMGTTLQLSRPSTMQKQ